MREHLHRAKRKDNREWIEGDLLHPDTEIGVGYCIELRDKSAKNNCPEVFEKTIGEFSGEYDKRHKRIFEDDFLKDDNGFVYRVVFETGAFCLVAVTEFNIPYDTLPKEPDLDEFEGNLSDNIVPIYVLKWNNSDWHNSFEIIGNIHDNPELLEHRIRKL